MDPIKKSSGCEAVT